MPIATARPIGYRPRPVPLWSSREAFFSEVALFILGAAGLYSANIIGSLPGNEVLLIPLLPLLLLSHGRRAFDRQYLPFYILAGAWLLGTQIADTYNAIATFNRLKGTARVVFFILDFTALAIFINNRTRRMVVFALSIAAVLLVGSREFSGDFSLQWKFGFSQGFAILALLGASYFYAKRRYRVCFFIWFVLVALNLKYGFRSQLAIHVASAVLILPLSGQARGRRHGPRGANDTSRVLILLALAGGAVYAANASIKYAAQRGFFDESQSAKFLGQAEGDYGVLVGGRPETLVAIQAILDSPIIGHGSFPYGLKYLQLKQDIQYEHGYTDSDEPEELEYPVIPTHSHLTLAWVEGGILGGICWIYIMILVVRGVLRLSVLRPHLAPLYSYLLVGFLWDILYSPFGSVNRVRAAFYILLSYFILRTPAPVNVRRRGPEIKVINRPRPPRLASRVAN
jgi:hypothetical protein